MMTDIRNLQAFALYMQKTDIKFDLFSITKEMEKQIGYEFDFKREADAMERIRHFLHENNKNSPVMVPRVIRNMVTRRVLVMEYIDGIPILKLGDEIAKRGINPGGKIAAAAKRNILKSLAVAYGQMILKSGFFHADPHPGNILICKGSEVALLDYGQVKDLPDNLRLGNANLVIAIADKDPVRASLSYRELGIHTLIKCEDGQKEMLKLAQTMFDTKLQPGVKMLQPFSEESSIKKIAVQAFPEELFSVLCMVHLLRGLSVGLEINYSCAEQWRPIVEETLYLAGRLKGNDLKTGKCRRGLFKRIFGSGGIVKTEYMQARIDLEVLWCSNSIVRSLSAIRASTSPDWRRTLLPSNHLIGLLNSSSSSSSPVVPFSATLLFSNPTAMASIPNPNPSPAYVEAIEEIMKTYKSLLPRPTIEKVKAATSLLHTVETEHQSRLSEISVHVAPPAVPPELFSVLQQVRKSMALFQSHEQKKEATHLVELDEMFQTFDELIQRASELVFGTTQIEKSVDLGDPVGEIGRAGVIEKRVFGESVIDESSSIMAKTDDDFKYSVLMSSSSTKVESTIEHICRQEGDGAILVFLTGWDDISKLLEKIKANSLLRDPSKFLVLPLHSSMPTINQCEIFDRPHANVRG
ncbi:unnamed protein product [Camellia sinensis]